MSATLTRQGEMKGDLSFQGEIGSSFHPDLNPRAQPVWSCCIEQCSLSAAVLAACSAQNKRVLSNYLCNLDWLLADLGICEQHV
jgi:hypothetical protein